MLVCNPYPSRQFLYPVCLRGCLTHWLQRLWFVLLCSIVSLAIGGCPPAGPPGPPAPRQRLAPPDPTARAAEQQAAFATAEAIRAKGVSFEALQAFRDFVARYPSGPLTDDALLTAGQIATSLGDYRNAQAAYQSLLDNFPTSEHRPTAYLELGIVRYNTQDYDRSRETLQHYLGSSVFPERQATAHYYLGLIAYQQQRYTEALEELKRSTETSSTTQQTEQARAEIARIVRDNLTTTELERLARQYPNTYPGDVLLYHLALHYREADNTIDEMAVLQKFTTQFPEHLNMPEALARLHDLQAPIAIEPTKIGVLLPLSGDGSQYGQSALQGIELGLTLIQEREPRLLLSLVIRDDKGTSAGASEALTALAGDVQVIGVIGPLFSQMATNLAPLTEVLNIPLISPYASDSDFPALSPYTFRNSLTDAMQGRFLAEYAVRGLDLRRIAILYPNEPNGISLKDAFSQQVTRLQGEIVAEAPYAPEATDFSKLFSSIGGIDDETLHDLRAGVDSSDQAGTNPTEAPLLSYDAIFLPGYYDKVGLIAPSLALYNITGVQLLGSDGWNAPALIELGQSAVEGAIFVDGFFADSPAPLVREFVERFRARYNRIPDLLSAQAYDTLLMLAQVLKEGAKTRSQLRDGLLQVQEFAGVSGTTSMLPDGDADKIPYLLTVQGGRIVQLN
jgi:branched-chain amino acid transport system substrate-binding protein